jgi:hypothetical protein
MLRVSGEVLETTIADSMSPNSENKHTTVKSGRVLATGAIGKSWVRMVVIGYLGIGVIWRRAELPAEA